jgi:DNA-binding MarR family transcriptional regulator
MAKRNLFEWEKKLSILVSYASAFKGRKDVLNTPESLRSMNAGESYILSYLGLRRLGPNSKGVDSPYFARLLNVPPGTAHSNLRGLKDKGLIKMVAIKKGGGKAAASTIRLTEKGEKAYIEMGPFLDEEASKLRKDYCF